MKGYTYAECFTTLFLVENRIYTQQCTPFFLRLQIQRILASYMYITSQRIYS